MADVVLLSRAQMARLAPQFPRSRGKRRVDDRRVISGIVFVIRIGLMWKDAPRGDGRYKTPYNRLVRWNRMGVFERIFAVLAAEVGIPEQLMVESTHLQAHRTAASLPQKGGRSRCIGRTKGGLNSKLDAVCDRQGRPVLMLLTEGRRSDPVGVALLLPHLPHASVLLADRHYDSNRFRTGLEERGITPCIPPMPGRRIDLACDKVLYRQRHKVEIMFGRLKDWRRIAMRSDRSAHIFFSAICIAATHIQYGKTMPTWLCHDLSLPPESAFKRHPLASRLKTDDQSCDSN